MKVLMIHVGNEIEKDKNLSDEYYLERKILLDGSLRFFAKHNIITADQQMQSIIDEGIEVEYGHISNRKSIKSLIAASLQIQKICKEKEIDLVHVFWGASTALFTILSSPKPVIISFCGSDLLGAKNGYGKITARGIISRFFSLIAASFSGGNITKSEQMKSTLWSFTKDKTTVIPNGINLSGFYPIDKEMAKQHINLDSAKKYILFFKGDGQRVKNIKLAEETFHIVKQKCPECEFLLVKGLPHEQLVYYYNACDVMLLTSFHEGSNNSIKEARACNMPIVSVNAGDAKERLENIKNCYVLNWEADKLAEKIISVLESGERSNGVEFSGDVEMSFIAKKVIDVYKKVLKV